ncbi:hypothetical protein GWK36_06185 [Caldichromatium japonicum]|uniref:RNA polymerase sigma-70 region 2 domain-containing protein n=2 Tax=Caldichromatium japonicum TaxID=2699430 RepID=A0A6G7VCX1_9GAMM|nr:hypothetical protein GWK36_06185 [Caldichromatium japonicum]
MHGTPPCLLRAWSNHAPELKRYLDHRLGDSDEAADLLQDAFIKAHPAAPDHGARRGRHAAGKRGE